MPLTRSKLRVATDILVVAVLLLLVSAATLSKVVQYYGFGANDWDTGILPMLFGTP